MVKNSSSVLVFFIMSLVVIMAQAEIHVTVDFNNNDYALSMTCFSEEDGNGIESYSDVLGITVFSQSCPRAAQSLVLDTGYFYRSNPFSSHRVRFRPWNDYQVYNACESSGLDLYVTVSHSEGSRHVFEGQDRDNDGEDDSYYKLYSLSTRCM